MIEHDTAERTEQETAERTEPRRGRPRDPSRDEAIIDATIDVLVRDGYDRLSMEGVAAAAGVGKATVYRRWAHKAELVIDAMATLKPAIDAIDTGSLDGDIELMVAASCSPTSQRLLAGDGEHLLGPPPRARAARGLQDPLHRAAHRAHQPRCSCAPGRAASSDPNVDVAMAASLVPSLMLQRATHDRPAGRPRLRRAGRGQRAAPGARPPRTTHLDHRHGDTR